MNTPKTCLSLVAGRHRTLMLLHSQSTIAVFKA